MADMKAEKRKRAGTGRASEPEASVREQILAAAKTEFARLGLRGASVRGIASGAGVTPAMINYHFQGKLGLYKEVVEAALQGLMVHLSGALLPDKRGGLGPALAGAYFDFLCQERELQRIMVHEVLAGGGVLPAIVQRHLLPLRALLQGRFGKGQRTFQSAVTLFGAVAGYFLYAPVLAELTGEDPLEEAALARRRRHVVALARDLSGEAKIGKGG